MKLIFILLVLVFLQAECFPQRLADSSPNVQLIQEQLQQLLDQEAKLQALRQMLLAQLNPSQQKNDQQVPSNPASNHPKVKPIVGNVAFGSADVESKPNPSSTSSGNHPVNPASNFPFTEVHLESGGIQILTSKEANRRYLTN